MKKIIIIGAGLAGCTIARILADKNYIIEIYEEKNHIGGNLYDFYDSNNVLIHKYGPHIFHTSYKDVWNFLNRFSEFNKYKNKVLVKLNEKTVKLPINLESINDLFPNEFKNFLNEIKEKKIYGESLSIFELLNKLENKDNIKIIKYIYKNVYAKYTSKMWGKKINEIPKFILERVKINLNYDWNYFPFDKYQGLPKNGYTEMLQNMIDHKNIKVFLNKNILNEVKILKNKIKFNNDNEIFFYTGMIDKFFNFKYGNLEYRSLEIKFESFNKDSFQETAVINYPLDKKMTRITEYKKMTLQKIKNYTTISKEFPGEYNMNGKKFNVPFYPINDDKNQKKYEKYLKESEKIKNLKLIGRLAEYKYYDMDDIVYECFKKYKDF